MYNTPNNNEAKFTVITLCGSTRFKKEFELVNQKLTLAGYVVISVGVFGHTDNIDVSDSKEMLDMIHLQKIDMADQILVVDVHGYIGNSTQKEIDYAKSKGKKIGYLSEIAGELLGPKEMVFPLNFVRYLSGQGIPDILKKYEKWKLIK